MDGTSIGVGLALGSGLGVVMGSMAGALTGDVGLWVAMGVPFGAGLGLAGAMIWWTMNQPTPPNTCPHCGYDTTGLPKGKGGAVCPECGGESS